MGVGLRIGLFGIGVGHDGPCQGLMTRAVWDSRSQGCGWTPECGFLY